MKENASTDYEENTLIIRKGAQGTLVKKKSWKSIWMTWIHFCKENKIILDIFMCKEKFSGHRKHLERYTLNNL